MDRTILRALSLGSLVAALALAAPGVTVFAEDEAPAATGIQWVHGWEAGKAQAAKDGRLVFLYFGRHTPR